jgi:transcriptional regulator with XRE-family HTH domain
MNAMPAEDRATLGARLGAERRRRGLTKPEMARRLAPHVTEQCPSLGTLISYLKRWEAGKSGVSERYRFACAAALGMDEAGLFGLQRVPEPDSAAMSLHQGQRVIQALDAIGNDHFGGVADSLAQLVDHYALAVCALPPADVYDELLTVRSYASGIIERPGFEPRRTDLVLAAGWLSNLLAVAACDMGEHGAARVWCSEAERCSEGARHPELAAWAALTKAMIAYYQGHAHQSVMLADQGQQAVPMGTVVHAKLATQEMRAAAMAGDAARMTQARHHATKAIAKLASDAKKSGAFSIAPGEDPPYTATSLLLVGRFRDAVPATEQVIQTVYQPQARQRGEHPSGYARALLVLGLAQAGAGRLDEAVAAGNAALNGSRPAWPTMVLAGKLDHALARNFTDTHQTAAYHARYLQAAGQPSRHHIQLAGPLSEDRE